MLSLLSSTSANIGHLSNAKELKATNVSSSDPGLIILEKMVPKG